MRFSVLFLIFFSSLCANIPRVSFEQGFNMQPGEILLQKDVFYSCKSLYEDYMESLSLESEYQIPKIIHFIWLGSPLPKRCQNCIDTWKTFHPDWTVWIWKDEDVANFPMINTKAYTSAVNFGQKSDILRYEILYQYGGLYLDTDFECLKNFDSLHRTCSFYAGVSRCGKAVYNGLFGCSPKHPIIKACIEGLQIEPGQRHHIKIMEETGPYYFAKIIAQVAPDCPRGSIAIFPPTFFYPYPGIFRGTMDKEARERFSRAETMAIHYWATSWQKS